MTPEQEAMLSETNKAVRSIEQLLKGYGDEGGLCEDFSNLKKSFYTFRLAVIVAGVLFSSGSGFGFAKLLELIR